MEKQPYVTKIAGFEPTDEARSRPWIDKGAAAVGLTIVFDDRREILRLTHLDYNDGRIAFIESYYDERSASVPSESEPGEEVSALADVRRLLPLVGFTPWRIEMLPVDKVLLFTAGLIARDWPDLWTHVAI